MKIVNYGQEILEQATQKVTEFNDELVKFTEDMISTMKESNGVGLSLHPKSETIVEFVLWTWDSRKDSFMMVKKFLPMIIIRWF